MCESNRTPNSNNYYSNCEFPFSNVLFVRAVTVVSKFVSLAMNHDQVDGSGSGVASQ